jgi:pimeloyl-ACP methyl ester carboxylesterase
VQRGSFGRDDRHGGSARPVSRWLDLGGRLHYVDHGGPAAGPLLVCVHGLGGSHLNWSALAPLLTPTCRVLAVDLGGHGKTRATGRDAGSVPANRRLLDAFLHEVARGPAILVGNSMGGMISVLEAGRSPAAVAGLVLVDPALPQRHSSRPDPRVTLGLLGWAVPGVGKALMAGVRRGTSPENAVAAVLRLCCVDPGRVPAELVAASVELTRERRGYPGADAEFLAASRTLLRVLVAPGRYLATMQNIKAPVLLLHGAQDRLVSLDSARRAAAVNPGWQFEVLDEVGHVPQLEAPGTTAALITGWLRGAGAFAAKQAAGSHRP